MMAQKESVDEDLVRWLLGGEPWTVHRTLTDLVGRAETDREVAKAKKAIPQHPLIRSIFEQLNADGYWGTPKDIHTWWPRKNTTFWLLPVLADFGFTVGDPRIARGCEYVFTTQLDTGAFGWDPPNWPGDCHTAIIVESLAKLGLLGDPRLAKAYDWLDGRQRLDGGFWCKDSAQPGGPREKERSCALATMFVLGAFAQHPTMRSSELADRGVDFLLQCWKNRGKVKYAGHDSQVGTDWEKLKYPFTDYKILKFLDVLSQFPHAKASLRNSEILKLLFSKQDANGRFTPESIIKTWSAFDFGQKDAPSRWVTLLVWRIWARLAAVARREASS
jgi:hypothetical protein